MQFPLLPCDYIAVEIMPDVKCIGYCDGNLGIPHDAIVRSEGKYNNLIFYGSENMH